MLCDNEWIRSQAVAGGVTRRCPRRDREACAAAAEVNSKKVRPTQMDAKLLYNFTTSSTFFRGFLLLGRPSATRSLYQRTRMPPTSSKDDPLRAAMHIPPLLSPALLRSKLPHSNLFGNIGNLFLPSSPRRCWTAHLMSPTVLLACLPSPNLVPSQ